MIKTLGKYPGVFFVSNCWELLLVFFDILRLTINKGVSQL